MGNEYNVYMPRAALFVLLVACVLPAFVRAQRAVGHAARQPARSTFGGQRGFPNRFSQRRGFFPGGSRRHGSFGSYFDPYDEPFGYEYQQADDEPGTNGPIPRVVIPPAPEPPVPKGQVIEIPGGASTAAKVLPPTIFILANGERLETRRFVLTATLLSINIDRQRRTVPLNMLDINATVSANHERGIDLRVPDDRNEISVSF
jgi:hypothetical protein